jgi:hypothetical protein
VWSLNGRGGCDRREHWRSTDRVELLPGVTLLAVSDAEVLLGLGER